MKLLSIALLAGALLVPSIGLTSTASANTSVGAPHSHATSPVKKHKHHKHHKGHKKGGKKAAKA